jgi:hypothetical protein
METRNTIPPRKYSGPNLCDDMFGRARGWHWARIAVLAFSAAGATGAFAQMPQASVLSVHPDVDSASLYEAFTCFHTQQIIQMTSRAATDSKGADDLRRRVANQYRVSSVDLNKVEAITAKTQQKLNELDQQSQLIYANRATASPAVTKEALQRIDSRRYLVQVASMNDLRKSLSPSGWAGLRSFINLELRNSVHTAPAPPPH